MSRQVNGLMLKTFLRNPLARKRIVRDSKQLIRIVAGFGYKPDENRFDAASELVLSDCQLPS